jgi:hypothetical protein
MTASFIYNQKDYYSENKGIAFPGYLISQLGWSWIGMILVCLSLSIKRKRYLNIIAIFSGIFIGLIFLHGRPNSHAFPEFLTLTLCLIVFTIQSNGYHLIVVKKIEFIIIAVGITLMFYYYPLKFGESQFISEMNDVDKQIIPIISKNTEPILIAVMYPQSFWGSIDAWCRGSKNIMDKSHSSYYDSKFNGNTCIVDGEYTGYNPSLYNKIYSIRKIDESKEIFFNKFKKTFPLTANLTYTCNDIEVLKNTTFKGVIIECDIENR